MSDGNKLRLQKIIADAGLASRREAEGWIKEGRVKVNGQTASLGDKADPSEDHIKIGRKLISKPIKKVVIVLFKPKGILPDYPKEDTQHRECVYDLIPKIREKVHTIGRLDTDSEGIILLTNDGQLSQRVSRGKYDVPKNYKIKIDGQLDPKKLKRIEKGMPLEGRRPKEPTISHVKIQEGKSWIHLETTESRNRIIRKTVEALGHKVDKVSRESFCGISIKGMKRGQYRYLENEEVAKIREWVGL